MPHLSYSDLLHLIAINLLILLPPAPLQPLLGPASTSMLLLLIPLLLLLPPSHTLPTPSSPYSPPSWLKNYNAHDHMETEQGLHLIGNTAFFC